MTASDIGARSGAATSRPRRPRITGARQREVWRRRLLPAVGIGAALADLGGAGLSAQGAAVHRAVAAAGRHHALRQVRRADAQPAADRDRGDLGLPARQHHRDPDRHRVRAQEDHGGGVLPGRGGGQHDPGRRQGADPGAAARQRHGAEDRDRGADLLLPDAGQHGARARIGEPAGDGADARALGVEARGVLQAAPVQLAAVSVLGAEDLGLDLGDRRDRRRVDRLDLRHRRADHPGDVQFRLGDALRDRDRRLGVLGRVLPGDLVRRTAWSCAGRRRSRTELQRACNDP